MYKDVCSSPSFCILIPLFSHVFSTCRSTCSRRYSHRRMLASDAYATAFFLGLSKSKLSYIYADSIPTSGSLHLFLPLPSPLCSLRLEPSPVFLRFLHPILSSDVKEGDPPDSALHPSQLGQYFPLDVALLFSTVPSRSVRKDISHARSLFILAQSSCQSHR